MAYDNKYELEEAARRYQEGVTVDTTINYCGASEDVYFANRIVESFIAGAERQASQMPMPEDTVLFNKGVAEGRRLEREDMMKDAVEGTVTCYYDGTYAVESCCLDNKGYRYHSGDKVRIVVLGAEE